MKAELVRSVTSNGFNYGIKLSPETDFEKSFMDEAIKMYGAMDISAHELPNLYYRFPITITAWEDEREATPEPKE